MSQVILITGPDADEVRAVLERALGLYRTIAGLIPERQIQGNSFALAIFDSVVRPGGARLYESELGVAAGVGHWFGHGRVQADLTPLLHAANQPGCDLVARIADYDGCFAFLLLSRDEMTVVTDPIGRLHLYQAEWGATRLVCTSSLVLAALLQPSWQMLAVREFLALGYVLGRHSLFEGIDKFGPAAIIRQPLDRSRPPVHERYWQVSDWLTPSASGNDDLEPLASALQAAVSQIYNAYEQPALDLTGGFDSRALLGATLRRVPVSRIQTVVSGPETSADVSAAQRIAEHFDFPLLRQEPQPADAKTWWTLAERALPLVDGEYDVFEYASILAIHSALAQRFGASVNGSGGELCRGYWWELLLPFVGWQGHFDSRQIAAVRFATDLWADGRLAASFDTTLAEHVAGMIDESDADMVAGLNTSRMDNVYLMLRMQRWQGRLASATGRLWPCFSPFLMKPPMQAALQAGVWPRIGNRMARRLIARLDRPLAELPMDSGLPAAPLAWHNAWRFRGAPPALAHRALGKAVSSLRARLPSSGLAAPVGELPAFADEAFHEWWAAPLTASLYRPGQLPELGSRIADSPHMRDPAHLGRLTTLEMVARTLRAHRS